MIANRKLILGIPFKEFLHLFVLYTVAHGGIFFILQAVYWDDWVLFGNKSEVILDTFKQAGFFLNSFGYLHRFLTSNFDPWIYKLLTFAMTFFGGVLLYRILKKSNWVPEESVFWIVLLYLCTPLYIARVAMINFPYTLCLFLFLLGWFLIARNRSLSIFCFFLSFNTQSLLVFYSIPIAFLYFKINKKIELHAIYLFIKRHLDFILLPIVWFAIKFFYFKPYGIYVGYNEHYAFKNIKQSIGSQYYDFIAVDISYKLLFIAFIATVVLIRNAPIEPLYGKMRSKALAFSIGAICLILGLFPYWILGHVPTFSEWTSRHQLLMPLGASIMLVVLASSFSQRSTFALLSFLVAVSLTINWKNYYSLYFDWKKQKELIGFMSQSEAVKSANLVVFQDLSSNALNRSYRFYEWNGLLKVALPDDERKFGINLSEYENYKAGGFDKNFNEHYQAKNHKRDSEQPVVLVTLEGTRSKNTFSLKTLK